MLQIIHILKAETKIDQYYISPFSFGCKLVIVKQFKNWILASSLPSIQTCPVLRVLELFLEILLQKFWCKLVLPVLSHQGEESPSFGKGNWALTLSCSEGGNPKFRFRVPPDFGDPRVSPKKSSGSMGRFWVRLFPKVSPLLPYPGSSTDLCIFLVFILNTFWGGRGLFLRFVSLSCTHVLKCIDVWKQKHYTLN